MRSILAPALALAGARAVVAQDRATSSYVDPATGITFQSFSSGTGYRFGMVLPPSQDASSAADVIIQLVSPLDAGAGWAGVDFGSRMLGPLLLVAWPKEQGSGSASASGPESVVIAPRVASSYRQDGCVLYTATPISLRPIAKGTFVNATHLSVTFVCTGCVGSAGASFDPGASATQEFAFAYSQARIENPATQDAVLPPHNTKDELYGPFGVDVAGARSADYAKFAAMASSADPAGNTGSPGSGTSTGGGGAASNPTETSTGNAGVNTGPGTSQAMELEYASMSSGGIVALVIVGMLYLMQGFSVF